MSKPKVIKDFDKLDESIQERIRENYPDGFDKHLIKFVNIEGKNVSALPFETEDRYYLVRMTLKEARQLSNENEDEDFDPDAISAEIKDEFKDNFGVDEAEDEKDDFDDKDDYDDDDQDEDDDKNNDDY